MLFFHNVLLICEDDLYHSYISILRNNKQKVNKNFARRRNVFGVVVENSIVPPKLSALPFRQQPLLMLSDTRSHCIWHGETCALSAAGYPI